MNTKRLKHLLLGTVLFGGAILQEKALADSSGYMGSSFNEVWDVVENKNFTPQSVIAQKEFAVYQSNKLPQYPVNSQSVFGSGSSELERDAKRTVSESFDYYDRIAKKLHPNGVCVAGEWSITSETPFTGYFSSGSKGLFIGRVSVTMGDTTSDEKRGFGFAGKVFPTTNPDQVVGTGNLFTVDVLLGTSLKHVLDAKMTNAPETGFKLSLIGLGLKIASALKTADENPGFRPLTQISSMGLDPQAKLNGPHWVRLSADNALKRNASADFRNEILVAMKENQGLKYYIEVSNTTSDRNAKVGWTRVGELNLNKAKVSYGCDRRLHFSHPKLN